MSTQHSNSSPNHNALLDLLSQGQLSLVVGAEDLKLLPAKKVAEKVGMSIATFYRTVKAEDFPSSIDVGSTMKRWVSTEVDGWILEQIRKERTKQLKVAGSRGGKAKAESLLGRTAR